MTDEQIARVRYFLAHIRPDWRPKSVMALIEKNHQKHDLPELAQAAVNAATNATTGTCHPLLWSMTKL